MPSLGEEPEVVVVGAGAAGLAAARRLTEASVPTIVIEARTRIGGRAWTWADPTGLPLDLGCGWLHSADRNPWVAIAEAQRLTIDRTPSSWGSQAGNHGFSTAEQAEFRSAYDRFEQRVDATADGVDDRPASDLLAPDCRWNPLINALSSYINGSELDHVSVRDFASYVRADSEVNWRVREGYGTAIAGFGRDASVMLETPVTAIEWDGPRVRVASARGVIEAKAAIVTVPTTVLASEAIIFRPALADKLSVAAHLPLGAAEKLFLRVVEPDQFAPDTHLIGRTDRVETGSYYLRPFGRPLIEAFLGGANARALASAGLDAAAAFAIDELVGLLGSDIRRHLKPVAVSDWSGDPFARGSYSHALPGHAGGRALLAEPIGDRLFFAGEACSVADYSTAHGAYASGIKAAEQVLEAFGR